MSAIVKAPAMQIRKIKPDIGAEVTGIDLRQPVDEVTRQTLYDALVDNVALVIRDQVLRDCRKIKFLTFGSMRIFIYR